MQGHANPRNYFNRRRKYTIYPKGVTRTSLHATHYRGRAEVHEEPKIRFQQTKDDNLHLEELFSEDNDNARTHDITPTFSREEEINSIPDQSTADTNPMIPPDLLRVIDDFTKDLDDSYNKRKINSDNKNHDPSIII